ncbi:DUF4135 domain-containing protein [Archangium sp.]|uniref:DUF4135 domain-containing protein n=1 Tax=Archangium sp. TaxID=1872627 RepID=UPI003899FC77
MPSADSVPGGRCPSLRVVDRDSHGWVEFVDATGCDSREALQRFYWRQGIGYGLLRLAAPERVPSVLTLALP